MEECNESIFFKETRINQIKLRNRCTLHCISNGKNEQLKTRLTRVTAMGGISWVL